ncbi:SAM-dependent methyltransferase [Streptomyces sp. Z26]|uniref:SAM-dependent methyltransferase n=1 Tax=Streptomyces sp. Z26 TaxID=2500177 RepID=UPI000EF1752A|nr:SAM-dependent methyltransferase [Streptomyces sp. Z26]RLL69080.1 SAM-dependent methyltransferase [Streptomyces sp. Z26]
MTSTLVQETDLPQRARDWAELQERMLVPLYEAVYDRLDVGAGTRLLGLGCGSGLALLLAAARGATVTGVDSDASRLDLARALLLPRPEETPRGDARLVRRATDGAAGTDGSTTGTAHAARADGRERPDGAEDADAVLPPRGPRPDVVTAFDALAESAELARTAASLDRGTPVVLAGWGPPERCGAAAALDVAARLSGPPSGTTGEAGVRPRPGGRDDLEELARRSGLRPDGSGRVACPFTYADMDSAVRGLLSTGLYDDAVRVTGEVDVCRELTDALRPHLRPDGTVWMPNLFRYVIART